MGVHREYFKCRDEWLALRADLSKTRIGGSELGTASGHNKYKSAYALWAERCGLVPTPSLDDKESVRLGHDLEEYVARRFAEATGKKVHAENCIYTNDDFPHLFASIDRKVANESSGLECKTTIAYRSEDFKGELFPESYYAQCLQYMAVTGLDRWFLAVLVMGVGFRIFCVTRKPDDFAEGKPKWLESVTYVDESEIQACEKVAANFMARVFSGEWPNGEIDGSESTAETLEAMHGTASGSLADLSETNAEQLLSERAALNAEIALLDAQVSEKENQLRALLGNAEGANLAGWRVTYKEQTSQRLNTAAVKSFFEGREDAPADLYRQSVSRPLKITAVRNSKSARAA